MLIDDTIYFFFGEGYAYEKFKNKKTSYLYEVFLLMFIQSKHF